MRMIHFTDGVDIRCRVPQKPTIARFTVVPGDVRFVVIGTPYGFWFKTDGTIRTWHSYSGARKAMRRYCAV